jgi:hypothetical protein
VEACAVRTAKGQSKLPLLGDDSRIAHKLLVFVSSGYLFSPHLRVPIGCVVLLIQFSSLWIFFKLLFLFLFFLLSLKVLQKQDDRADESAVDWFALVRFAWRRGIFCKQQQQGQY